MIALNSSTIFVVCKSPSNRHRENSPPGSKVESVVMDPAFPAGKAWKLRADAGKPRRAPGMRDHGRLRSLFNNHNKEAFMTRTLALVLVLVVLAGSQPAVLLQRLVRTVELLLNMLR
jgi:hypothetical protein